MTNIINKITIHRFRSISDVVIKADEVTIFSGVNNAGKSNVLRALNLFFNGEASFGQKFDFEKDYNKAYTGKAGGKREIKIELHFDGQGEAALKAPFSISKTFSSERNEIAIEYQSANHDVQESIKKKDGNTIRQFRRFSNKIEYFYIPAVRGADFVRSLFLHFKKLIEHDSGTDFNDKIEELSEILQRNSHDISVDFEKFIGLPTQANLSSKITDILGTVEVNVRSGISILTYSKGGKEWKDLYVNLFSSGDGILMSYLAFFLAHISKKIKSKNFIWGFEEPENSLEYSKIQKLAEGFIGEFKKNAQILITTHSPAFIKLKNLRGVLFYRVYIKPGDKKQLSEIRTLEEIETTQKSLFAKGDVDTPEYKKLKDELAFVEFANEIEEVVKRVTNEEKSLLEETKRFRRKYTQILQTRPQKIFICEDSDKSVIELWKKLLTMYGLTDVEVMTSEGHTNIFIENGVKYQKKLDNSYDPKIFRQIDRDGLIDTQIDKITKEIFMPVTTGIRHKFKFLPVNEIENFAVIISKDFSEAFWNIHRISLEDAFNNCAHNTCLRFASKFRNEPLFNVHRDTNSTQSMKEIARTDWKKYFQGKNICAKVPNFSAVSVLASKAQNELPDELKHYLGEVKDFFNG